MSKYFLLTIYLSLSGALGTRGPGFPSLSLVYNNRLAFIWPNGEIPYKFDPQETIDDNYKKEIENVFDYLNAMLHRCIIFR